METSPSLAVESFSYSWLSNSKTPFHDLDITSSEAFFKELDQMSQSFDFDVPNIISNSPTPFNHADELFSQGLIKPLLVAPPELELSSSISAMPVSSSSFSCTRDSSPNVREVKCRFLGRWRRSSGRMLNKCWRKMEVLCSKARKTRKSPRVDDIWNNNMCYSSPRASPLVSTAYLRGDWGDMESSIYEAVLHCKRSIEK